MEEKLGIWLVRSEAEAVGLRLNSALGGVIYRPWQEKQQSSKEQFAKIYKRYRAWIMVGTTGIAVRFLQGLIGDKRSDPAVVVVDEGCRYAVSLLGGHEGGANEMAVKVANLLGCVPVVTTATEAVKPLILGIGCRKGSSAEDIEFAVRTVLGGRSFSDVRELATIDLKAKEPGLLEFCQRHSLPLRWFGKEQVAQRSWVTSPSALVKSVTGADGVCEPCALMVSPRGRLVVPKTAVNGVTVAIVEDDARAEWE